MKSNSKKSITVMVPAYNEHKYLGKVIARLIKAIEKYFDDYEILIFDDCSSDDTGKIADALSKDNNNIKVIHNKKNKGWGYNYREGIKLARKKYFMYFPGDGIREPIETIIKNCGKSDIIVPYIANQKERGILRSFVSQGYVAVMNTLFNMRIKYYNGFVITKTKDIKKLKLSTDSFALQTEVLIKLIKKGNTYIQVPYITSPQETTNIFKIRNVVGVFKSMIRLFIDVNIRKTY